MVLIAAAIIDGLIYSGREGGRRLRPVWWVDLHRGLGGYALIFTVFHLLTAYGAGLSYRIIDFVVPGAPSDACGDSWCTRFLRDGDHRVQYLAKTIVSSKDLACRPSPLTPCCSCCSSARLANGN